MSAALVEAAEEAGQFRVAVYAPGHHDLGPNMTWKNPVARWLRARAAALGADAQEES